MTNEERRLEVATEAAYNTHWGPKPSGHYPPCWVDLREETKEFVRAQIRNAFKAAEKFDEELEFDKRPGL